MSDDVLSSTSSSNSTFDSITPSERLKLISKARALSAAAARLQNRNASPQSRGATQPQPQNHTSAGLKNNGTSSRFQSLRKTEIFVQKRLPSRDVEAVVVPTSIPLRPLTVRPDQETQRDTAARGSDSSLPSLASSPRPMTVAEVPQPRNSRGVQVFRPFSETAKVSSMIVPFSMIARTEGNIEHSVLRVTSTPRVKTGDPQTVDSPSTCTDETSSKSRRDPFPTTLEQVEGNDEDEAKPPCPTGLSYTILSMHAPSIPSSRGKALHLVMGQSGEPSQVNSTIQGTRMQLYPRDISGHMPSQPHHRVPPAGHNSDKPSPRRTDLVSFNERKLIRTRKAVVGDVAPGYFASRPLQDVARNEQKPHILPLPEDIDAHALHEAYLQFARLHEEAERSAGDAFSHAFANPIGTQASVSPRLNAPSPITARSLASPDPESPDKLPHHASETDAQDREPYPHPNPLFTYDPPILIPEQPTVEGKSKWQAERQGLKGSALPALWIPVENVPPLPTRQIAVIQPLESIDNPTTTSTLSEDSTEPSYDQSPSIPGLDHASTSGIVTYGQDLESNLPARKATEPPRLVSHGSALRTSIGSKGCHRSVAQEVLFEEVASQTQLLTTRVPEQVASPAVPLLPSNLTPSSIRPRLTHSDGGGGGDGLLLDDELTVTSTIPHFQNSRPTSVLSKPQDTPRPSTHQGIRARTTLLASMAPPQLPNTSTNHALTAAVVTKRPITADPAAVLGKLAQMYALPSASQPSATSQQAIILHATRPQTSLKSAQKAIAQDTATMRATLGYSVQKQLILADTPLATTATTDSATKSRTQNRYLKLPTVLRPSTLRPTGRSTSEPLDRKVDETLNVLDDRSWLLKNAAGLASISQAQKAKVELHNRLDKPTKLSKLPKASTEVVPADLHGVDTSSITMKGKDDPFAHIPAFEALKTAVQSTLGMNESAWAGSNPDVLARTNEGASTSYTSETNSPDISRSGSPESIGNVDAREMHRNDLNGFNNALRGLDPKIVATLRHGHGGLSRTSPRAVRAAVEAVTLQAGRLRLWKGETTSWSQKRSTVKDAGSNRIHHRQAELSHSRPSLPRYGRKTKPNPRVGKPSETATPDKPELDPDADAGEYASDDIDSTNLENQISALRRKIGIRGLKGALESSGFAFD